MGKLLRAHSCTKAATQERLSKAMVHQIWLGYLLMSLWVVITDAADHSSSSVPLLHRKLARSSFSYVVAPVKEYDQRHFCDKVHPSNSFLTRALAASPPPTQNYLMQTPFSSFISYKGKFLKTIAQISSRVPSSSLYRGKALLHVSSFLSTGSFSAPSPSIVRAMALNPPPPIASHLEGCCSHNSILRPGSHNCSCVYPIMIELLLLNVSSSSTTWSNEFLQELASQLHLSVNQFTTTSFSFVGVDQLNITMDIVPVVGMSFSFQKASGINYTLVSHRVNFNRSLFGGYELMNFTWIQPPALPPAIPLSVPIASPEGSSSTPNTEPSLGHRKKQRRLSLAAIFCIAATVFVIVLVLFAFFLKRVLYEDKKKPDKLLHATVSGSTAQTMSGEGVTPRPRSTRFFSFEELKEATNNFEPASMLGEGGFGRVFKGVLKDGTFVAIKKLSSGGHQGDKEFSVEVDMLSRLHHRNLVKLVGYYSSRDSSQHLLCYELVPNGSLEAWLHGPLGANHPLDWDTRMKIALDSARGLAYLHEDSQPCVIHRDFKASNILLENNFHAKVADFGLAKQAPEGRGNYLSTRVMGTFGYVAPEYAMTGHLLVKSDVYSYGVVLLELLTGRRPVDMSRPSGQENLVTWARPILRDKDRVEDLADPRLYGKYQREDFLQVCAIAAACVAPEASQRPTMGEVVQSLKMVQRLSEYHHSEERSLNDNNTASSSRPPTSGHAGPSSTTFESDASSTFFSSGPYSGLSGLDNDHLPRTGVFSEDLQEGR